MPYLGTSTGSDASCCNRPSWPITCIHRWRSPTFAAVVSVVLMLVDPDIPHNDGVLRCIDVIAPSGSFLNCAFPSPCVQGNFTSSDVAGDSIFLALSEAIPDRVCAGWSRNESHMLNGVDPRTGERFHGPPLLSNKGGAGATSDNDGWSFIGLIACGGGYAANDYEMFEIQNPVRILHHEYWTDSGGRGPIGAGWASGSATSCRPTRRRSRPTARTGRPRSGCSAAGSRR